MSWTWPVPSQVPWEIPVNKHPGAFGVVRKHDTHTGIDLYCPEGNPVHAVESGIVVRCGAFTGPDAESPWWLPTRYVLVEGISGVVCYGEIQEDPNIVVGAEVRPSQRLGSVRQVLKNDKGTPQSMLHLELYDFGFKGEPVWWKLDQPKPEALKDPTKLLRRAWLKVTDRFHRDAAPPPETPEGRKELVTWLLGHPVWTHPLTLKVPPGGRRRKMTPVEGTQYLSMESEGPDWVEEEHQDGSFNECATLSFVYVNPTNERREDDEKLNTAFRVWIETGGYFDQSTEENGFPAPAGGWTQWNKWIGSHDINLDCGGATMEEALINLALLVRWYYGENKDYRPEVKDCGSVWDEVRDGPNYNCRDGGDGFCKTCGYKLDFACPHLEVEPSKTYPDGSVDGACVACGEDGFPLVDGAYESFSKTPEGQYRCSLRRMVEKGLTYPEALRATLAEMPEGLEVHKSPILSRSPKGDSP